MKVNEKQMALNLELQNGLLLSEKVMFELGKRLGKQTAHSLVYQCSMQAFEQNKHFKEALMQNEELAKYLSAQELEKWLNPQNYLGNAPEKVDAVIQYAEDSGLLD